MEDKFLDFDARRKPLTDHYCVKCQRDLKPDAEYRLIVLQDIPPHISNKIIHPDDLEDFDPRTMTICNIGMNCAKTVGLAWTISKEELA